MKNKIILVTGYPAAGKSTFSKELAMRLNIPCFNKDNIKEILGNGFGPETGEVYKKGSAVTVMLLLYIAECFLKTKNICILESNFSLPECEEIKSLLNKYNYECLTFVFIGNLDVLSDRYFSREKSEKRSWVFIRPKDKKSLEQYCLETKLGQVEIGETIIVDTTSFKEIDFDKLFITANNFIVSE